MLPPVPPKVAPLEPGERHLHSAQIRLCGWEKKMWPFRGYMPSEVFGGVTCLAHWTDRRVIMEPQKAGLIEKLLTAVMTQFLKSQNELVGKKVKAQVEATRAFSDRASETGMVVSMPHSAIEKYQLCSWYVQLVPRGSEDDSQTLCFAAWEMDSSTPRVEEVIGLGNRLVASSRA